MIKVNSIADMQPGKLYTMISHQFKAENKVIFITPDCMPLNRQIGYFCFAERGNKIPTAEQFKAKRKKGEYILNTFAIWQHEIESGNYEITFNL